MRMNMIVDGYMVIGWERCGEDRDLCEDRDSK